MQALLPKIALTNLFLFCTVSSMATPTLDVGSDGRLLGATGVDIDGVLYRVEFIDATCAEIFAGCDSLDDFVFQSQSEVMNVSQALFDQVFIDSDLGNFDSNSTLTNGCEPSPACFILTIFQFDSPNQISYVVTRNGDPGVDTDGESYSFNIPVGQIDPDIVSTNISTTYARWTIQAMDSDGDDVDDNADNCSLESNIEQTDIDSDGLGNACDPDFNNDCIVNFLDYSQMTDNFLSTNSPLYDLNNDGVVNFIDIATFSSFFLMPPGPSGISNSCDLP